MMEYVPGQSLEDVSKRGPMDPAQAVSILTGAAPPSTTPTGKGLSIETSNRRTSWSATTVP